MFNNHRREVAGEYLKKAKAVYIEGRRKTGNCTDKDGAETYTNGPLPRR